MKTPAQIAVALMLAFSLLVLPTCGGGSGGGGSTAQPESVTFVVRNGAGLPIIGATVYLVPSSEIDGTVFDSEDVNNGLADDFDEPLEDAVRLRGSTFPSAVTDADGRATVDAVTLGDYFWFVQPAAGDEEHLPGGSGCRTARKASNFLGLTVDIDVSGSPTSTANHVGSSLCLVCHPAYATMSQHAHRLGFAVPGKFAALQDATRYPDYEAGWDNFTPSADYTGGTEVWYSDFDSSRGFDKFKTSLSDPSPAETVYAKAWLWQDTIDDKYKITLENVINPGDPRSPWTLDVELTYGGAVYKQRHLVSVPGLKGRYPLLQYQTQGDETRFDRTRKAYRDYHLDWFWDAGMSVFKDPPITKNFEGNCTGCHSNGFSRFQDPVTMEWLSGAANDPAGAFDIDGDGTPDEINTGCESCHGPGSDHITWASGASPPGMEKRYIVQPQNLSPSREVMICGRCHGRPRGNGPVQNDEPLNLQGEMLPVGASRQEYLQDYTVRGGPTPGSMWSDRLHSKSHRQQYEDFIRSTKHRNDRILVTCSDCHDGHGDGQFENHLTHDPRDPNSQACGQCHAQDPLTHMLTRTGAVHAGSQTACIDCHMTDAAKSGAGRYGILLDPPTGTSADPANTYFENDISSHLFLTIPKKSHPSVAGATPGSAMPIPYTMSCGAACHDASQLQFQIPIPLLTPELIQQVHGRAIDDLPYDDERK